MQIFKTNNALGVSTGNPRGEETEATPPPADSEVVRDVEGFFGQDGSADEQAPPATFFDLVFTAPTSGIPAAAGMAAGGPSSIKDFVPLKVVTLQEYLTVRPEGRYSLDNFIKKMETIRDKRYATTLQKLRDLLQAGGLSADETLAVQKRIEQYEQAIAEINTQIEKAREVMAMNQKVFELELRDGFDYTGDGIVGDPADEDNSFLVGHAENDPNRPVLLTRNTEKPTPAVNPFQDKEYKPALASTENLKLAEPPVSTDGHEQILELNSSKHLTGEGYADSFGAQIDITAAEGFWVEIDPVTKEPILEKGFYRPKKLEGITRSDDKPFIGQNPPTEEERKNYKFIRATDLVIHDEPINRNASSAGGDVIYTFKDRKDNIVMRLRIKSLRVDSELPLVKYGYIAATSVGIAVNAATGIKHSARISPLNVDASGFTSTGKVLPARPDHPEEIDAFYDKLGINARHDARGSLTEFNEGVDPDTTKGRFAADYALRYAFLDYQPSFQHLHYTQTEFREELPEHRRSKDIARRFGHTLDNAHARNANPNRTGEVSYTAAWLPNTDKYYTEFLSGVAVTGIRGVIQGTAHNDIIVVPPPNDEEIQKMLSFGAAEIDASHPAYGTVVAAGDGRNIVVSKGGDLYASGVTFLWRESERDGDQVYVKTNNGETPADSKDLSPYNQAIFVRIADNNPGEVQIDNGSDNAATERDKNGNPDDWYDVPQKTLFTQRDQTSDLSPSAQFGASVDDIKRAIADASTAIREKVIDRDPNAIDPSVTLDTGYWGQLYGKQYEEWTKASESFFNEWEFFRQETGEDADTEEVSDMTEDV